MVHILHTFIGTYMPVQSAFEISQSFEKWQPHELRVRLQLFPYYSLKIYIYSI